MKHCRARDDAKLCSGGEPERSDLRSPSNLAATVFKTDGSRYGRVKLWQ